MGGYLYVLSSDNPPTWTLVFSNIGNVGPYANPKFYVYTPSGQWRSASTDWVWHTPMLSIYAKRWAELPADFGVEGYFSGPAYSPPYYPYGLSGVSAEPGTQQVSQVVVQPSTVAVINLVRRPDRLAAFQQRWQTVTSEIAVQVFDAVDGLGQPGGGGAACLESHLRLMEAHTGPLAIFEDDAVFADEFTLDLHAPADWDILWLGGQNRVAPEPYTEHWAIARDVVRTHAYIVRDPQRVASMMREAGYERIDPHLSYLPLRQYILVKPIVGQAAGVSDATGEHFERDTFFTG